ncbi:Ser/Thr protein phosphatase superfamily [Microdochium trichocladiopsis]|uniref:Ser/Thr protein phosphatase superfamily n=1 Tax=Microdochium trichocladiopsis TaxID=1682393 RepID=A0A9P8Y4U5_9PEZI|nr:Ser/Thr protein phosphatase superfamily [Microdochium trichocladiopsis]KAH7029070.1 Ser/Thr protein phosphatase superfamily [Microdochium trichocladiopsis]
MVEFQIVSDLHLESPKAYDSFEISPRAPYLALLGDIGCTKHRNGYLGFLRRHLHLFKIVFLVLGNHEPWYSSWDDSREQMREFEETIRHERNTDATLGEFVFLDKSAYTFSPASDGKVTVLGCTLFSRVPEHALKAVSFGIKNFYHISGWTVEEHDENFQQELSWLNDQVRNRQDKDDRLVIFTHHSPSLDDRAMDPKHKNSLILSGFASDLSSEVCWTSPNVKLWAFGHNHFNCDFIDEVHQIRVFTNQRGYAISQSHGFDAEKIVIIKQCESKIVLSLFEDSDVTFPVESWLHRTLFSHERRERQQSTSISR